MGIIEVNNLNGLFDQNIINNNGPKVLNKHRDPIPDGAVYIGRGSAWGNPYVIGRHGTREEVIDRYRRNVLPVLDLTPLKGKHLVCFCKPKACHGDLLLAAANQ